MPFDYAQDRLREESAFFIPSKADSSRSLSLRIIEGSGDPDTHRCKRRNSGNAASRVEAFIQSKGPYAYGGYPDIDELFRQQAIERDQAKREAMLYKIQQLSIDRVMYAPVLDFAALMGIGPRVTKHTITDVWMSPFPSYEDIEIKG